MGEVIKNMFIDILQTMYSTLKQIVMLTISLIIFILGMLAVCWPVTGLMIVVDWNAPLWVYLAGFPVWLYISGKMLKD